MLNVLYYKEIQIFFSVFARGRSMKRIAHYSTTMESIQAMSEPVELENEDIPYVEIGVCKLDY